LDRRLIVDAVRPTARNARSGLARGWALVLALPAWGNTGQLRDAPAKREVLGRYRYYRDKDVVRSDAGGFA
jgi:hypothetical protein